MDRLLALVSKKRRVVAGDGNCQYRAVLAAGLSKKVEVAENILDLRVQTYRQLVSRAEFYKVYLTEAEGDWASYVSGVLVDGTWGDHIALQAMSDYLEVGIRVFSIYVDMQQRDYCLSQEVIVPWFDSNPDTVLEICNIQALRPILPMRSCLFTSWFSVGEVAFCFFTLLLAMCVWV